MNEKVDLEEVIKRLDQVMFGQQRQALHLSRIEAKLDGDPVVDAPITVQELNTEREARKLMAVMKKRRQKVKV